MAYIDNIIFTIAFLAAGGLFARNASRIWRNIQLGRGHFPNDKPELRLSTMLRVAVGQTKMVVRPVAAFFHILIYVGFVLINLEVLEIVIDGIFGTHRVFAPLLGPIYPVVIGFFEVLGVLVLLACVVFLWRRNVLKLGRFHKSEMQGWPFKDANYILIIEIVLMCCLLTMNAAEANIESEHSSAPFLVSQFLAPLFAGMSQGALVALERLCWWGHILGIFCFLNYLPYSKHLHIMLAFPNVYFSNLNKKGQFTNLESVKKEVELMMDPNANPYAAPAEGADATPQRFGAKDVMDLSRVQLLNAYSCTECGRCTSVCPANLTGKKLSPRKIVMDTRDRMEEVGNVIDQNNGSFVDDGRSLLHSFITPEEVWACTSCNACVEACPVNIDPLGIIIDLRRYLVMEESAVPTALAGTFSNIENNGAPWQYSPLDRGNWRSEG